MSDEKNVSSKPKGKLPKWVWILIIGSTLFYCIGCTALLGTDTNNNSEQEVKKKENKEETKKEITPKITISEPGDNKEVEGDKITFKGNVRPNKATVTVKDKQVEVADNGDFVVEISLEEGENNIEVKATHENKDITVTRIVKRIVKEDKKTLGISYNKVLENLEDKFVMKEATPVDGETRYMSETTDSLATMEIIGEKNNVSQATLMIGLPNDDNGILLSNTTTLLVFLKNTFPENYNEVKDWTMNSVDEFNSSDKEENEKIFGEKSIKVSILKSLGILTITVKHKDRE